MTLDAFDRPTAVNDPVMASDFTWTYRADGLPSAFGQPNGNATDLSYDKLGRLTGSDDDTAGGTDRAVYGYTYNRAGQILTEAATVTGDASNGTITYAYDPLGRLASSTLSSVATLYGWDAVPNRTSVKVGAGATATTSFNAADRPTSGTNPTVSYSSDDDGRLTARPNQTLIWDHLGRLTTVKNAAGTLTLATYTYDPLDRLRMIDYGGGVRIRFRYVGLTTAVAQWIDDAAGTVTRSVGTGWRGERLLDWTGSGSNVRIYGENGHHDVTWLASDTGPVSQSLRYDPYGNPRATVPTGYTPFRFQGSYHDATTDLSWVVTRWYAAALGTFISEDSLLGEPIEPPSRHLYAYGQGEPIGHWDPDGMKVLEGDGPVTTKERPKVLSPINCSSRSGCIGRGSTDRVAIPRGAGRSYGTRGWKAKTLTMGWVPGLPTPAPLSVDLMAVESVYARGTLVTVWTNYDIRPYATECIGGVEAACATRLTATFKVRSGSSRNGIGFRTTTVATVPFSIHGGRVSFNRSLANAPQDFGHVNIWIPIAWGDASRFAVEGGLVLKNGGTVYSALVRTTSPANYIKSQSGGL